MTSTWLYKWELRFTTLELKFSKCSKKLGKTSAKVKVNLKQAFCNRVAWTCKLHCDLSGLYTKKIRVKVRVKAGVRVRIKMRAGVKQK